MNTHNSMGRYACLSACVGVLWSASAAAAQEPSRPELRLVKYEGELCPPDSLKFPVSSGALAIRTDVAASGDRKCHIEAEIVVPAGLRFRASVHSGAVFDVTGEAPEPDARVSFVYCLGSVGSASSECLEGSPSRIAGESFSKVIVPVGGETPQQDDHLDLTAPECSDPTQPMVLPLSLDIAANLQGDTTLRIYALSGAFMTDLEMTSCEAGF